jgi:hypothetical protein
MSYCHSCWLFLIHQSLEFTELHGIEQVGRDCPVLSVALIVHAEGATKIASYICQLLLLYRPSPDVVSSHHPQEKLLWHLCPAKISSPNNACITRTLQEGLFCLSCNQCSLCTSVCLERPKGKCADQLGPLCRLCGRSLGVPTLPGPIKSLHGIHVLWNKRFVHTQPSLGICKRLDPGLPQVPKSSNVQVP